MKILIKTSKKYPVFLENRALLKIGTVAKQYLTGADSVAVISDTTVTPLYGAAAVENLKNAGFNKVCLITVPNGESAKSFAVYSDCLNKLADFGLSRKDALIGVGGGVVGDLTGFLAATYLRGIRYASAPTTLLAMIDSSIGGKTGINITAGKNLVGAFKQPEFVLTDPETLKTLPESEIKNGTGELLKYALLIGNDFFETVKNADLTKRPDESLLKACIEYKGAIVAEDEFEQSGKRAFLNLGHTLAHSIEKLTDFTRPHGLAVGTGLIYAAKISEVLGYLNTRTADIIKTALQNQGFSAETRFGDKQLLENALNDKKSTSDNITLVLLKNIGEPTLHKLSKTDFLNLQLSGH